MPRYRFVLSMSQSLTVAVALLVAGCGGESGVAYGRALFSDASVSTAMSNKFSCSTCHAVTPGDTRPLPGYDLVDVTARAAWWGGNVIDLRQAVNQCVTDFMGGQPLAASDEKGRALLVYLESISPHKTAPTLPLTVVQNIVNVPSGNKDNGKVIWGESCGACHGAPNTGDGRLTELASIVPNDSIAAHGTNPKTGARPVVIEKVRHGKYFNVGGFMPLFVLERLSDAQLGDVLAYLETFGLPASAP
jgi:thiosulfate dehydrogenase